MTTIRSRKAIFNRGTAFAACALVCFGYATAVTADGGRDNGSRVMSPGAAPYGYSVDVMTRALAMFQTSGNVQYYPVTPFQVLSVQEWTRFDEVTCPHGSPGYSFGGVGTFPVTKGVSLFVPLSSVSDSPPVLGTFPTTKAAAIDYMFNPATFALTGYKIIVDGRTTVVGPGFLGAAFNVEQLADGEGHNLLLLGGFVAPLSIGRHTVRITGTMGDTPAFFETYGYGCQIQDITYTINVMPPIGQ